MIVLFKDLPLNAKIWIFQTTEPLTPSACHAIATILEPALQKWESHGMPLKSGFEIVDQHFLIVGADAQFQEASGCSIDKLRKVIDEIQYSLDISFSNQNQAIQTQSGIEFFPVFNPKRAFEDRRYKPEDLIFNLKITEKIHLKKNWKVSLKDSFFAKYL